LGIVLSVLRYKDSDYPFGIFKLFLILLFIIVQFAYFHLVYRIYIYFNAIVIFLFVWCI